MNFLVYMAMLSRLCITFAKVVERESASVVPG